MNEASHAGVTQALNALIAAAARLAVAWARVRWFVVRTYLPGTRTHRLYEEANAWASITLNLLDADADERSAIMPLPRHPVAMHYVIGRLVELATAASAHLSGRSDHAREFIGVGGEFLGPVMIGRHWADELLREAKD